MKSQSLNHAAASENADAAAVRTVIESVMTLADSGNFESLEKLYADEVRLDYTSAFGGEPELKSPHALMTEWAGVLPGFDRTRHALSNINVELHGTVANATAEVTADHYLGESFWQVSGGYTFKLEKDIDDWKISMHRLTLKSEVGSRDILQRAKAAAALHPVAYLQRHQTQKAVRDFLAALEVKDMEKFASVWSDDAVQEMPYSPEGFPKRVESRVNLIKHYASWPANSGAANFTKELVFYPTPDPQTVFVEFHGLVDIIPTGRRYDQRYAGLFHVENGKITLFREYYNPNALVYAFALNEGGNFHGDKN